MKKIISSVPFLLLLLSANAQSNNKSQQETENDLLKKGQWANYGNDPGGMRFTPLLVFYHKDISSISDSTNNLL